MPRRALFLALTVCDREGFAPELGSVLLGFAESYAGFLMVWVTSVTLMSDTDCDRRQV